MDIITDEKESLYQEIHDKICMAIFQGEYEDGDLLPPERRLAEDYGVSRVTVRKALDLLAKERIIERVQGSGTRVSLCYEARQGKMDLITVVSPAQNEFFASMLDTVQTMADALDILVLFQQKPKSLPLDKCLYRLYRNGLRNVILWKEDMELSDIAIQRLKGLGMNLVLFDAVEKSRYADVVGLDNPQSVGRLIDRLHAEGCRSFVYVGWDNMQIGSIREREAAFLNKVPDGRVIHIPYIHHNQQSKSFSGCLQAAAGQMMDCDAAVYCVGELGIACESLLRSRGCVHSSGMIGMMPGAIELGIHVVEQDYWAMAERMISCLSAQNNGTSEWKPARYKVEGIELN